MASKRKMKAKILDFLSDGQTWKIVEIAHGVFCSPDELIPILVELVQENRIDMGGYESDPDNWKFVRLHTDKLPGMEHMVNRKAITSN